MKKSRLLALVMAVVLSALVLSGCALKEAVTSRKVVPSEDGKRVELTLKAETAKNLEWKYAALKGNLTESQSKLENDMFSDTFIKEYTLSMNDTLTDTLVLFLIQDGDIENSKAYLYEISFDGNKVVIGDPQEKTTGYDKDLMAAAQSAK